MPFSPPPWRFSPSDPLLIAFSGGPDSVYTAEQFLNAGFQNLTLAHFHHHLRGKEADYDAAFCRKYAEQKKCSFIQGDWEKPEKSEEKARKARYDFLEESREKVGAAAILTGHHKNDQAETIFLQCLRGSGIRGLKGMSEWDEKRKIWRPLLSVSKREIVEYLHTNNIPFCEDSSNETEDFTRNFLRNSVFPLLEERFEKFSDRLVQNSEGISSVVGFLEESASLFFQSQKKGDIIKKDFFALHPALRYEVLRMLFLPQTLESKGFSLLEDFFRTAQSRKKWEGKGIQFEVFGEHIFYTKK